MNLPTLILSSFAALGLLSLGARGLPIGEPSSGVALAAPQYPAQGGHHYTVQSLKDTHGFTYSGSHLTLGAIASSGVINFDGHGNVAANYSTSVNGTTFTGSFTGTYTVNPDGTGSIVLSLPLRHLQAHGNFVLIDNGDGTFFMSTDAGYSVTGSTRKI